ncbi:SdpI family protein [Oceanithermus sp.]
MGVIFFTLGRKAARGELKPNHLVGLRTARTLASEEAWYRVHARAAPFWVAAGVVLVLVSAAVLAAAALGRLSLRAAELTLAIEVLIALAAAVGPLWADAGAKPATEPDPETAQLERGTLAALLGFLAFILLVFGVGPGYLLATGALGPNGAVGVRVHETMASSEAWYRVNRPAGWAFMLSSLVGVLACAWGAFALPRARRPGLVLAIAFGVVLLSFAALGVYTATLLGAL